jgi:HTH-type transcriptional regulator, sugar sensing transcriptional regulator
MAAGNKLLNVLTEIGLSENESHVYLGALGTGACTMQQLARASSVKRTTIYSVMESLKQKGLVRVEIRGFKKRYVAESPEKLESILDSRKMLVRNVLPEFLSLYNLKESDSFIKYYEGIEGTKTVYEGLLADARPGDDYLIISEMEKWYALAPEYFQNFLERRARMDLKIRVLLTDTPMAREQLKTQPRYNWKLKLLPPNTRISINMVIIPKKVVIHQTVPPSIAMVIENKAIVQMHQELFEIIWAK